MKLYLDQMFHADLTELLRANGYDVLRAEEVGQARSDDAEIIIKARAEGRVLITQTDRFLVPKGR
jgi:predicted nuclease of predicted toxin-antitoxin system